MDEGAAMPEDVLDLSFPVRGGVLPRAHRAALARALAALLPWLPEEPGAGVHRLNLPAAAGGPMALLSGRTRLTLRLPRARLASATQALAGAALDVGDEPLRLGGEPQQRELLPFSTQYAHFVAAAPGAAAGGDELAFLAQVQRELQALGVAGRAICGRHQRLDAGAGAAATDAGEGGSLGGYSLMIDGLTRADALRLAAHGIGAWRLWGCGIFVPHKSAAAVGARD